MERRNEMDTITYHDNLNITFLHANCVSNGHVFCIEYGATRFLNATVIWISNTNAIIVSPVKESCCCLEKISLSKLFPLIYTMSITHSSIKGVPVSEETTSTPSVPWPGASTSWFPTESTSNNNQKNSSRAHNVRHDTFSSDTKMLAEHHSQLTIHVILCSTISIIATSPGNILR